MRIAASFSLLIIGSSLFGQIVATAGPSPAPLTCPIAISVANDTPSAIFLPNPCPFRVRNGPTIIYQPFCIQIIVNVNPGAVFTTYWDQRNDFGQQVAPGNYTVDVFMPGGGMTSILVTINATVQAAATSLGPNRIGTTRNVYLCAPTHPNQVYWMGASGVPVSGGIPTCGGVVPLEPDWILQISLNPNPFFTNFAGFLSNTGQSTAPALSAPLDPALIGVTFVIAFVTLDLTQPCPISAISPATLITIV